MSYNRSPTGRVAGYKIGQVPQFTPEQMSLFQNLFSQVSPDSYLSRLSQGDKAIFDQIEAPALQQFNQVLGGLGSRFSGMGSGARKSSGFKQAGTAAASDFAQNLASQRQQLQRQALMDLMGISESLLNQRPYETFLYGKEPKQSFLSKLFGGLLAPLGAVTGGLFGGPGGARIGGQIGSGFGQSFY